MVGFEQSHELDESVMILGQVSYLDCVVFLIFLAPQLLYHVGLFGTLSCAIRALPFLSMFLPCYIPTCFRQFPYHHEKKIHIILFRYSNVEPAIKLPLKFIYDHTVLPRKRQNPFVQQASLFEDFVIRCVRYAFANIPARVGRIFFSKAVALPFLRFRMLRHGYLQSPIHWQEVEEVNHPINPTP